MKATVNIIRAVTLCITFILFACEKDNSEITEGTVTDIEGNVYKTVKIVDQWWMAENLKVTKYFNDVPIPVVASNSEWQNRSTPAYCWYDNQESNKSIYGALYNWYAVSTGRLCPTGWHVPSISEWSTLIDHLEGISVAGGKLKETSAAYWQAPNTGATNESGFTALPSGYRNYNGVFYGINIEAEWLSSTEKDDRDAWEFYLYPDNSCNVKYYWKTGGRAIRCIKD